MLLCQDCDFRLAQSGHLNVHSRKHTGEMLWYQHFKYTMSHCSDLKSHSRNDFDSHP